MKQTTIYDFLFFPNDKLNCSQLLSDAELEDLVDGLPADDYNTSLDVGGMMEALFERQYDTLMGLNQALSADQVSSIAILYDIITTRRVMDS